jgi:hypothetical protein
VIEDGDLEEGYTQASEDIPGVAREEAAAVSLSRGTSAQRKDERGFPFTNTAPPRPANMGVLTVLDMLLYFPFVTFFV